MFANRLSAEDQRKLVTEYNMRGVTNGPRAAAPPAFTPTQYSPRGPGYPAARGPTQQVFGDIDDFRRIRAAEQNTEVPRLPDLTGPRQSRMKFGHKFLNKVSHYGNKFADFMQRLFTRGGRGMRYGGACWKNYTQKGMKMKNGKSVPNCVPRGGKYGGRRKHIGGSRYGGTMKLRSHKRRRLNK
jgi:hypothetical protein